MNPKDFAGINKWKFLIPGLYIISWLLMIFGPLFFPKPYQIYCIIIIVYSLLKTLGMTFGALVALILLKKTIKKLNKISQQNGLSQQRIISNQQPYYHAIIIPSYKEDEEVLLQTLDILSKSPRAKNQFIIMLAMQAHEKGSDEKANKIIFKTKQNFRYMSFTQHIVRDGQAKGKASNVSWCVQHMEEILNKNLMISMNQVLLTIIDADSWAPSQYFQKIQIELKQRPQIKDKSMFVAPQIYTRNHLDVPVFNRIFDQMHSLVHLANMVAIYFSFPLSNYTISYNCAKKIGWWDTCADAIGQDFHTCQKCYWKTREQFITVPIYIPFNQVSLSTGEGYISDLKARFWQAQRHTLGVTDVAYCWNMLFKKRFMVRNFVLTILVTEVFAMAALIPWALLALGIQYKLVNNPAIHFFDMWIIDVLLNATPIFTVSSYVFFEWWKRVANAQIYKRQNDKWWRVLQYPILFMVALFGFSIPAFLMASFAVLCTTAEYKVAQKHIDNKNKAVVPQSNANPPLAIQNDNKNKQNQSGGDEIQIATDNDEDLPKKQKDAKKSESQSNDYLKQRLDSMDSHKQFTSKPSL